MSYRRRRPPRPSQFRCLKGLLISAVALAVMLAAEAQMGVVCRMMHGAAPCPTLPEAFYGFLFVIMGGGLLATGYGYYRDFVRGDYYVDLAEAGYL